MKLFAIVVIYWVLSAPALPVIAQVKLPQIIQDSMILQRDTRINIWGWASIGEPVIIKFNNRSYKTKTGNDRKWLIQLPPVKAGGPYTMEISGKNTIILHDILFGDVWFCAGQSNMEHQMKLHGIMYGNEIETADFSQIRQFKVPNIANLQQPQEDFSGGAWKWANPDNVLDFSAVAYFFAKALYLKYHIPVGIINASWGGVPIEAMMSSESLKSFPSILQTAEKNKDSAYVNGINRKALALKQALFKPKDDGFVEKWYDPGYRPKGWRPFAIPGYWEDQGVKNLDGAVWFRREIDVPLSITKGPAKIFLGRIVDADELYINGVKVGNTGYMYPQRRYLIPDGILKPGKNLFVVHVVNNSGKGGFVPDKPYQLISGKDTIELTGYWQYKVGAVNEHYDMANAVTGIALQNQPTALYNSMIAPSVNYRIKGFVWYQGESNTARPGEYARLQPAMITDWRNKWKQGNLPFLFVQLPGFMDYSYQPVESGWALFREAQAQSLSLPNTGMAVAIDLGEWNDVHPDHKKEVGDRLAGCAGKLAYNENRVCSGPVYESQTIAGNKITLSFSGTGSGLATSDNGVPEEFAIAGADKKFVWGRAVIDGNKIIVSSDAIQNPKYIRYAWADDPVNPNLMNREGLPAAPFRTDK